MDRLAADLAEFGTVEQAPKVEGGSMTMVLAPMRRIKAPAVKKSEKQEEE
jgi:translation initiation factor IF-3